VSGPAPATAPAATPTRPYPSIPAVVFVIWALTVPIVFSARLLNADGDLLRHLRHGEWMLQHRAFLHSDVFSYTRGGDPFVAFEYGSQLLYATAHRIGGLTGVAILASLLIAGSYALLAKFLLARRADALLTYLVSIASAILGAVHWTARPHLFTLFAVMAMLFVLEPGERRPRLWLLVPAYALWANIHGGFVFGLTLLGIYLAGSVAEWWGRRGAADALADVRYYATALAAGVLGSLLNPNGWGLHLHIIRFFGEPFLRDNTHEFLSPDFHSAGGKMLLASLLAIVALFALVPGRPTLPRLFLVLANVAFALQARRNIQLYAATVFPILALHFDAAWRRLPDWRGLRAIFERDARRGTNAIFIGVVTALLCVLAVLHGRVGPLDLVPDRLDPKEFPIEAVARGRAARLEGRIFHDFIWGGYLLYAWPEQKVFIDGGTDFYGPDLMRTYMDVAGIQPGWRDTLSRRGISLVLMPTGSAMVNELAHDGDWRVWYCDRTAAFLRRDSLADGRAAATARIAQCADSARP